MSFDRSSIPGMRVTVMGLGLHGGGAASAAYFARNGAQVTVTDLRDEQTLADSIAALAPYSIRYVLGRHDERDFREADLVIKNPAVAPDSPYLAAARAVETDISVFLRLNRRPLLAVTGSKGKSTTCSALHAALRGRYPQARLGGNITVSPLTFLDELESTSEDTPIVLELSSWQLADLRGKDVLKPFVAVLTNILPDHQNRYRSMAEYVNDKRVIFEGQDGRDITICNYDDEHGRDFARSTRARARYFSRDPLPARVDGAWLEAGEGRFREGERSGMLLPREIRLAGEHSRLNLIAAGLAALYAGVDAGEVRARLASFEGIAHRMQPVGELGGVLFVNDSAATIPEATVAAVRSIERPIILIAGGTDKNLDFAPVRGVAARPKEIILVRGSATDKLAATLRGVGRTYLGPFDALEPAFEAALGRAAPGDVVLFSPGCASFELFKNEFDRGARFVALVESISHGPGGAG